MLNLEPKEDKNLSELIEAQFKPNDKVEPVTCSNCCKHDNKCDKKGVCFQQANIEESRMESSPEYLFIQILRYQYINE